MKKETTLSRTYAGLSKYAARFAVDRNTLTCMRAQDIGLTSLEKTVWWKVDLDGVYSIYSIAILFKNNEVVETRQRGRFAGFSLYVSNIDVSSHRDIKSSTLCYKDGPQLPPLNITITCTEYGRYVIFYNERLDENSYPTGYELVNVITELCEVVVKGCETFVYGRSCNNSCPNNCKYRRCHVQNGSCFLCNSGWLGTFCDTKCSEGLYGVNCSQRCKGHCRDGTTCNHVTGLCDTGCDNGWTGLNCEKTCDEGTFGYDCLNNCSGHCLNGSLCNKLTGHCDIGCNPGYTDSDCSRECVKSYGENCEHPCSQHCINQTCDRFTGKCLSWCHEGFYGEKCTQALLLLQYFRCLCLVLSFFVRCDGSLQPGFSKIQRGYRIDRKLIQSFAQFSFLDCVVECLVTPRCKSVNYFKGANFCETNYENKTTAKITYEVSAGWVYSEKEHWPKDLAGACAKSNCPINQTCKHKKYSMDPTNECVLSDCGIPARTDIDLSTTKREDAIGIHRRIHASCFDGYNQFGSGLLICQSNGEWKYDIHCEEKEWKQYLDHIYFHYNFLATWTEAKEHCKSYDAYLVAINTENENEWLLKTFVERDIGSIERCRNGNVFSCKSVWTGGWYKAEEDNFVWTNNNERVEFQKRAPNRPYNVDKDCIRLLVDGSLTNYFCFNQASFICEKTLILNK